ncbi:coth-domain-containing protein [Hesseltinella vesiculosa]|uniref:Coth-domain-containing protein n=1 Tax=Hesseltinella vesiculosa TaxID=101127 RepID=A0A1X2GAE4_9FUNG|nr:coth-domain-containing protein [Hesseltinella vesiculosa]
MAPQTNGSVLYQVQAPSASKGYHYARVNLGTHKIETAESFQRNRHQAGLNEVFGRAWNYRHVKQLPTLANFPRGYHRSDAKHLHPQNEIPTLHLQAPQKDIDNLHNHYLQDIKMKANGTYFTAKNQYEFQNLGLELSGRSTRYFTKLSYNINLPKGGKLDGYKKLKLRACGADPSYMREKLAYDMLSSAGRPGSRASYVRLIINDRPIGLFLLIERFDDHWMANEFGAGNKKYKYGILYKGDATIKNRKYKADLSYHGPELAPYEQTSYTVEEKPKVGANGLGPLVNLTKFLDDRMKTLGTNATGNATLTTTLAAWKHQFDIQGYFINLALEFLGGSFDTYLQNTNNYFLYKDPVKDQFVFVSWDMDMVMGSGPVNMKKLITGDYRSFPGIDLRPLTLASVMKDAALRPAFEKTLLTIVHDLFSPNVTFPVIDSLAQFIQDDAAWDLQLPHVRAGQSFIPIGPNNIDNWFGNNATNAPITHPITTDYLVAASFIVRVNRKVPLKNAIQGPLKHPASLYPLKTWIATKTKNVLAKLSA